MPSRLTPLQLFLELLADPERKSILKILGDIFLILLTYGHAPVYYFSRYLFKRDRIDILNYLPSLMLYKQKAFFNDAAVRGILDNKLLFNLFYEKFNLPLPHILMFNHRASFVIGDTCMEIREVGQFKQVLENLMQATPLHDSLFIKKTYSTYGGDNIYKLTLKDLGNKDLLQELLSKVVKTGYLFQGTIRQNHQLEELNPSCLNTLRLDTFIDETGATHIISCYFKTNIKNHYIDNHPAGGCEISVDLETGRLKKYGHLTLKFNGLKRLTEHPLTKMVFLDFQIPHFQEAKELVLKAAAYMPSMRLIGWDVAVGETGPVLVEGNPDYNIGASDLAYGGYKVNPVFQKVLKESKLH